MTSLLFILAMVQHRPSPDWLPVLDAPKNLRAELAIPSPATDAGPKIELRGRVLKADRKTPVPNVILYFHHTNRRGIYPRPSGAKPTDWVYWHGTLRGWLKTDSNGSYVLKTTRPAAYPSRSDPAHIHVYGLLADSRQGFYFSDVVFAGNPLLNDGYWDRVRRDGLDAYGGVKVTTDSNGVQQARHDFILPR